jgi:hypothetical protein
MTRSPHALRSPGIGSSALVAGASLSAPGDGARRWRRQAMLRASQARAPIHDLSVWRCDQPESEPRTIVTAPIGACARLPFPSQLLTRRLPPAAAKPCTGSHSSPNRRRSWPAPFGVARGRRRRGDTSAAGDRVRRATATVTASARDRGTPSRPSSRPPGFSSLARRWPIRFPPLNIVRTLSFRSADEANQNSTVAR